MIRMSGLIGLPVILAGRLQGHVEQAVLREDGRHLRGLTVRQGFRGARWVDGEDISVLGGVAVIVAKRPGRLPAGTDFALHSVTDSSGLRLGLVTDVWLDPVSLRVEALEITLGLIEALTCGPLICRDFRLLPGPKENRVVIPCGAALVHAGPADRSGEA